MLLKKTKGVLRQISVGLPESKEAWKRHVGENRMAKTKAAEEL